MTKEPAGRAATRCLLKPEQAPSDWETWERTELFRGHFAGAPGCPHHGKYFWPVSGPLAATRRSLSLLKQEPVRLLEVPAVLAILLLVAFRSVGTEDLQLYDETAYLAAGLRIRDGHLPGFTGGATYADLYYFLSHFTADPVGLYFAGRATAAMLFVLGIWIAARVLAGAPLAWVAAAAIAVTPAPYVWPGVSAPATGLLLVVVALVLRWPGALTAAVGASGVWIAAASRPELTWVAVLWSAIALGYLVVAMRGNQPRLAVQVATFALCAVVVPLALVGLHGSPFDSGGREWLAFQQHFSLRNDIEGLDPWLDSQAITDRFFPGADSVLGALLLNPSAFMGHIAANVLDAPRILLVDVLGMGTTTPFGVLPFAMAAIVISSLVVSIAVDWTGFRMRASFVWVSCRSRRRVGVWIGIGGILASALVSVSLVYPRQHYLLGIAGLCVLVAVAVQRHTGSAKFLAVFPVGLAIAVFVVFSLLVLRVSMARAAYPAPVAATVTRMIESGHEFRLLGGGQLLPTYVPKLTEVQEASPLPGETFTQLLERMHIDAVLTGSTESSRWASMPGFEDFAMDPTKYGFESPFPGSQFWLKLP